MNLTKKKYDLVAAGHLCLDIIPQFPDVGALRVEQLLSPGKLVDVGPCTLCTGGSVSNTGIACAKLGCNVAYSAKVGRDAFGEIVRRLLERFGSSAGVTAIDDVATSYSVVLAPPQIDRMFLHCPGANDSFSSESIAFDLVADAGIFHLGYPPLMRRLYEDSGRELAEILRRAGDAGATTSLDTALPDPASPAGRAAWPEILSNALPHVDIFLPSAEEALLMLDHQKYVKMRESFVGDLIDQFTADQLDHLALRFLQMGAAVVALKCGHRGYFVRTASADRLKRMGCVRPSDISAWADRQLWRPAYRVEKVVSAAGAGDASIAGFLTGMIRELSLIECLGAANSVGLQNLQALDTVSGIADWDTTIAMISSPPPNSDANVVGEGWRFDKSLNIWRGPHDSK